jgi:internalin A
MKKRLLAALSLLAALHLTGCAAPAATETPRSATMEPAALVSPGTNKEAEAEPPVKFSDPVLEAMIRATMGKPTGDISAAEAQAVTSLNLSLDWQESLSDGMKITNLGGLENFTNLDSLNLSAHAIIDISALRGLTKLRALSLEGNPLADISPLAGLTGLRLLFLSNCAAQDYTPLAQLVNLEYLKLDNSTISELTPLTSLHNLKALYLANSPIRDYTPLAQVYSGLEEKDFIIATTLEELGFTMDMNSKQARFDGDTATVRINHSEWGIPPELGFENCVHVTMYLDGEHKLGVGFYPKLNAFVFQMGKNREMIMNYVYDPANGGFSLGTEERERVEQIWRAALPDAEADDLLLAGIPIFNEVILSTFHMTAEALFALPFEPPTLKSLGFFPDKANAVCLYEQRGDRDYNIEIRRPEWGEKEYDIRFFTPLSEGYRIVGTYNLAERRFFIGVDDDFGGGGNFEYFSDTKEHVDGWCSYKDMTVEEYFFKAFNDPDIKDVYLHSIEMMRQYFVDRFGQTMEDLFSLPGCE